MEKIKCKFCGIMMEATEKKENYHVCPSKKILRALIFYKKRENLNIKIMDLNHRVEKELSNMSSEERSLFMTLKDE